MNMLGNQHVRSAEVRSAEVSTAKTVNQVAQEASPQNPRMTAGHDGKVSGILAHAHFGTERTRRAQADMLLCLLQWPVYAVNFLLQTSRHSWGLP